VANDAFDIVYQPIVGLTDGRIHHYEVLTRFAEGGSPFETLQLAENVGLICDFDVAVCRRVAQVIQKDVAAGKPLDYAVNLSGRSIQEARVIEALRKAVEPLGPHRKHFMVEVTESFKIDNLEQANRYIQAMRADGIRVCLDDFGAGEASFSYIQALAVDFVKVDGAYIQNMIESGRDMAILSAMVTLCRQLPVGTIAERVETKEQADRLRELGIGYGQGWYFGKPAKVPEKLAEEIYDSAHEFIQPPQRIKGHRSGGK
jgi:EAL domain-containing protein (putative c-di-GMP-specific phosphodiesterase class I)